jgi:predicted nucleotidyltransferase
VTSRPVRHDLRRTGRASERLKLPEQVVDLIPTGERQVRLIALSGYPNADIRDRLC